MDGRSINGTAEMYRFLKNKKTHVAGAAVRRRRHSAAYTRPRSTSTSPRLVPARHSHTRHAAVGASSGRRAAGLIRSRPNGDRVRQGQPGRAGRLTQGRRGVRLGGGYRSGSDDKEAGSKYPRGWRVWFGVCAAGRERPGRGGDDRFVVVVEGGSAGATPA